MPRGLSGTLVQTAQFLGMSFLLKIDPMSFVSSLPSSMKKDGDTPFDSAVLCLSRKYISLITISDWRLSHLQAQGESPLAVCQLNRCLEHSAQRDLPTTARGQMTSQGFTRLIICGIGVDGSAGIQWSNLGRGYSSFSRFTCHGVLHGSWRSVHDFFDLFPPLLGSWAFC